MILHWQLFQWPSFSCLLAINLSEESATFATGGWLSTLGRKSAARLTDYRRRRSLPLPLLSSQLARFRVPWPTGEICPPKKVPKSAKFSRSHSQTTTMSKIISSDTDNSGYTNILTLFTRIHFALPTVIMLQPQYTVIIGYCDYHPVTKSPKIGRLSACDYFLAGSRGSHNIW